MIPRKATTEAEDEKAVMKCFLEDHYIIVSNMQFYHGRRKGRIYELVTYNLWGIKVQKNKVLIEKTRF